MLRKCKLVKFACAPKQHDAADRCGNPKSKTKGHERKTEVYVADDEAYV